MAIVWSAPEPEAKPWPAWLEIVVGVPVLALWFGILYFIAAVLS